MARRPAFSLIEVMIAVMIFFFAILGALSALNIQWEYVRRTQERQYVSMILESRLEEIRELDFTALNALSSPVTFTVYPGIDIDGDPVTAASVDTDYQFDLRSVTGLVHIENIGNDLRRVTVEVTWDQGTRGSQVSMNTVSYITNLGLSRR